MRHHHGHLYLFLLLLLPLVVLVVFTANKSEKQTVQTRAQTPAQPTMTVLTSGLQVPWALVFLPNGDMLVTERPGRVRHVAKNGTLTQQPVLTIGDIQAVGEGGLLGMTLHPQFASNNFVYLYYTYNGSAGLSNKVVRYVYTNNQLTNPQVIVENIPGARTHDGGRIKFGPDGFLYITTGDAQNEANSQNTNSLAGKILRVTDLGAPAPGNPFNTSVYSYGHRNPQGITWNGTTLYATEHGSSATDELNVIESGKNYGWPTIRGDEKQAGLASPIAHSGTDTWAPSGMAFYNGSIYFAGLRGSALFEVKPAVTPVQARALFEGQLGRIRDVVVGPDNMLYMTTSNSNDDKIVRINFGTQGTITPSFFPLAPCPSCIVTPTIFQPSITSAPLPSTVVATPIDAPCESDTASIASDKKKSKHKHHDGDVSGMMEVLLRFFIEFINLLLRLFGGGTIPVPTPDPTPTEAPDPDNPEPEPDPDPCEPTVVPQPTTPMPTVSAPVSVPVSQSIAPTVAPTQPFSVPSPQATIPDDGFNSPNNPGNNVCIPSGQKCDATGARSCCTACVKNINVNQPDDPGTCD